MMRRPPAVSPGRALLCVAALVAAGATRPPLAAQAPTHEAAIEALWQAFWRAGSPRDAAKGADKLANAGVAFDAAWAALMRGRPYGRARVGERQMRIAQGGVAFDNYVDVPKEYDPARTWPVRVQLHGGIDRQDPEERRRRRDNRIVGEPQIYVYPFGWANAAWWHRSQVDNILSLVDRVKRQYNVDESRIYLTGTSDGGTGTFFLAMKAPTMFASFLPLIGNPGVLGNPRVRVDGQLYLSNLVNRPFFVINGLNDPKYPAARIAPYLELLEQAGVSMTFRPQTSGGHDTSWWGSERGQYESFVHEHPRLPHPARLSWETERVDRYNRVQWLVIDELGVRPSDVALEDTNMFSERFAPDFGIRGDSRKDQGTRIVQVMPESDAQLMGLLVGDRIIEIDDRPVADLQAIVAAFERAGGGQVDITVERGGRQEVLRGPFPPEARRGPERRLYPRGRPSGRVDVTRTGNRFEARTRGVARFTLLLSPEVVDFAAPVVVTVNGATVHDGPVATDTATLLSWAARDNDRTMLYGAAVSISVP
ncbi:MAG TPA: PDZ domain-containing protein [Vicinamibacterales bacterium]|nr:PDZ domain-containing protein [Vicinamibacterales bacterium]